MRSAGVVSPEVSLCLADGSPLAVSAARLFLCVYASLVSACPDFLPGAGNDNPFRYPPWSISWAEEPGMSMGSWTEEPTIHGVAKSRVDRATSAKDASHTGSGPSLMTSF